MGPVHQVREGEVAAASGLKSGKGRVTPPLRPEGLIFRLYRKPLAPPALPLKLIRKNATPPFPFLPAILADQGHEAAAAVVFVFQAVLGFAD